MSEARIGNLPAKYSFILNPYLNLRAAKCPICKRVTHKRKFALFLGVNTFGPLVLGKTCRYCSPCELIVAHKDEMDAELAVHMARLRPSAVGSDYVVIGTMDRKAWKGSLDGDASAIGAARDHIADFTSILELAVTGGWGPESEPPKPPTNVIRV